MAVLTIGIGNCEIGQALLCDIYPVEDNYKSAKSEYEQSWNILQLLYLICDARAQNPSLVAS